MALERVPSSGEGAIVSWKVVHRAPLDRRSMEWEPSIIAIVELDEGPWAYTTIQGEIPPPSDQPVRVRFEPGPAGDRFPVFATSATDRRRPDETRPEWRPDPKGSDRGHPDDGRSRQPRLGQVVAESMRLSGVSEIGRRGREVGDQIRGSMGPVRRRSC
ncbi:Zn-ribbon domain-containing OB-fold protein [Nocardia sp. NPDC059154]